MRCNMQVIETVKRDMTSRTHAKGLFTYILATAVDMSQLTIIGRLGG